MSDKPNQGGCQCGAVRFKTTSTPARAMACHCTSCKLRSGSPYGVGVYFQDEDIEFLESETGDASLGMYEFHSVTSNRWIRNEFCKQCGTAVSWTLEMRPGLRAIAGGCFDDPNWFEIEAHIWTESARSDMCYPDNVPQFDKALT
jgi:hypothetical protein